jgi:hypothetical protein
MKNQKTNGGSGAKAPARATGVAAKPAAKAAAPAKPDPRDVPAPIAPASVAVKAAEAIAAVPAVATAEPKTAGPAKTTAPKAASKPATKAPAAVSKPVPAAAKPAPAAVAKAEPVPAKPTAPAAKREDILPSGGLVPSPEKVIAPLATAFEAGANQARAAYARAQDTGDSFRQAVAQSTQATTRGLAEINGKVLDLIRAQNDATIDLWRSTLTVPSFSEAIRAQTSGLRQAYETTAAQWKDIAETAGRVMGEVAKPLQSAFTQAR